MSTDGSSLGWSDLVESRPLSSSNSNSNSSSSTTTTSSSSSDSSSNNNSSSSNSNSNSSDLTSSSNNNNNNNSNHNRSRSRNRNRKHSRKQKSTSSDRTTVHMSPKQTQTTANGQHSEELLPPNPGHQGHAVNAPGKAANATNAANGRWESASERYEKDTYIIYSAGNATLFMSSLDPELANDRQLELLERHLLDVKIAEPVAPLWPNPSVLTVGMRCDNDALPCSSSTARSMSAALAKRKLHAKSKCLKVFGQKKRISRVQAK